MGELMAIIVSIVYIIMSAVLAGKVSEAAQMKGHGSVTALCFLFGPAAYLYVVALPDLKVREQNEAIIKALKGIEEQNERLLKAGKTGSAPAEPKYSNNSLPNL